MPKGSNKLKKQSRKLLGSKSRVSGAELRTELKAKGSGPKRLVRKSLVKWSATKFSSVDAPIARTGVAKAIEVAAVSAKSDRKAGVAKPIGVKVAAAAAVRPGDKGVDQEAALRSLLHCCAGQLDTGYHSLVHQLLRAHSKTPDTSAGAAPICPPDISAGAPPKIASGAPQVPQVKLATRAAVAAHVDAREGGLRRARSGMSEGDASVANLDLRRSWSGLSDASEKSLNSDGGDPNDPVRALERALRRSPRCRRAKVRVSRLRSSEDLHHV